MKTNYLFIPEDSRYTSVAGIDVSLGVEKKSVLKMLFWIAISIAATVLLAQLG